MDQQLAGAIAGMIGGITIAATGMAYRAVIGRGFWSLPNGIGGIVFGGERGATLEFGSVTLIGVGLHMVLSAIYGVATVMLDPTFGFGLVPTGTIVGISVWLFNYYLVGAIHDGSRQLAKLNPLWMAFFLHALFGAVTGYVAQQLIGG